jgi:uncharacterized protein with von Willebrand factor type A (vWA) domain
MAGKTKGQIALSKGSWKRPVDKAKFDRNFERIFGNKPSENKALPIESNDGSTDRKPEREERR